MFILLAALSTCSYSLYICESPFPNVIKRCSFHDKTGVLYGNTFLAMVKTKCAIIIADFSFMCIAIIIIILRVAITGLFTAKICAVTIS